MEFVVLGWPDDGPTLRLDYRRFAYAGKFVMSNTGKAVALDRWDTMPTQSREYDSNVVAAVAFNEDRTDETTLWLRYVSVRADRRGESLGPRLCAFVVDAARSERYETLRIAVNNPFAYAALYKVGFAWTGETTGLAELVLERPADAPAPRTRERYQSGLERYRDRELSDEERTFVDANEGSGPPELLSVLYAVDADAGSDDDAGGGVDGDAEDGADAGTDTGR
ncbi:GNAT family N-acetyltransferase [Halogeometricum limi]|uniref:Acetyltransferase (GNAT) family protein n=1 Tax=Halogeometricum limi TaxID=555875 RepID=A0A1I6HX00_9EURY|nr:GNAT family N-acetyltransferase [Halogeometricum limi]SFR58740.1 Acetyltransferase (GNAT) family protein [Halogeometricum limi]